MARYPLIHIPYGIYSVTSKCNNDEFLFDEPSKFEWYLRHLIKCKEKLGFKMYDLCCMSNHVHELYRVPPKVTIATILHTVRGHFSNKYNAQFERTGHFWRNRSYYRIVENEQYAFNIMQYYHWNPVKAGMVNHPEKWPYSGYGFHMLGKRKGLIGKLLDPLESISLTKGIFGLSPDEIITTLQALGRNHQRFIGSKKFIESMKAIYRKDNQ